MAREERVLICPHCTFAIPITGVGSKTVVKVKKARVPKAAPPPEKAISLHDIVGDHYDPYWQVSGLVGKD